MGELHLPMISLHNSSLGHWDQYFHNLGVLNNTEAMSLVMDNGDSTPFFSTSLICDDQDDDRDDLSTGYLEDALLEFGERSKRRRLLMFSDEYESNFVHHNNKSPSSSWELSQNFRFSFMSQMTGYNEFSDGTMTSSFCSLGEEANNMGVREVKTPEEEEEEKSVSEVLDCSASSSSYKDSANYSAKSIVSDKQTLFSVDPLACDEKTGKKRAAGPAMITRLVYPFAVVKPGGREGDVTLNDINKRILMPPTRPVRHPVGDFACRPCVSPHGPGLSGKAVVAFTRIHTQGRGTITIVRTKG